ncbi:/ / putative dGTPase / 561788:562954 Reverse [Candidatus Hepatoplasma crinochetorum]|uniref:/ / putative dGTPase / 561788:562954 Reverse n=1 Tax=Candidatus Hepatoplasma crinochetorum TaxID=295596 RepID=A0A0G7ZLP4_9MOLU|nr:/ / putative dGTPase / 561788:562954 Reverse [Candidatus Hepatoplasma crinochetorum]
MRYITDNVLKNITFEEEFLIKLFNTKEFKRLARINQLGLTNFQFPGATHNRLSHSLGVYQLAKKFLKKFQEDNIKIDRLTYQAILASALLHDIGHGPFSHLFEQISKINHEKYSLKIINDQSTEINKILREENDKLLEAVNLILQGKYHLDWVNQLISSEIDVDRLDYLLRDSYHVGLDYGKIEYNWLIRNAKIIDNKLAFSQKAISTIEAMILGRYHMNKVVYNSPKNIACSILFIWFFKRLKYLFNLNKLENDYQEIIPLLKEEELSTEKFLNLDDNTIWCFIKKAFSEKDQILHKISTHLIYQKRATVCDIDELKNMDAKEEGFTWEKIDLKTSFSFYQESNHSKEALILFNDHKIKKLRDVSTVINIKVNDYRNLKTEKIGLKI